MLDGEVPIINGATSSIGERIAELLIEEGACVVFTGRKARARRSRRGSAATSALRMEAVRRVLVDLELGFVGCKAAARETR